MDTRVLERLPCLQTLDGLRNSLKKRITFWKCPMYKWPIFELVLSFKLLSQWARQTLKGWGCGRYRKCLLGSWRSFCVGVPAGNWWWSYDGVHEKFLPAAEGRKYRQCCCSPIDEIHSWVKGIFCNEVLGSISTYRGWRKNWIRGEWWRHKMTWITAFSVFYENNIQHNIGFSDCSTCC